LFTDCVFTFRSAEKNSNQEGKISKQKIDKLGDVRLPDFLKNSLDILFVRRSQYSEIFVDFAKVSSVDFSVY
jgi:hypothetical protein